MLNLNFSKFSFSPSYIQAGAVVLLLFVLVLALAQLRRHFVDWSLKGALFGLFFGFFLALVLEGFLVIGGKTAMTEVLGWKTAPQPVQIALEAGRNKLIQVLGITDEISRSEAKTKITAQEVINFFQALNPNEVTSVRKLICQ